MPDSPPNKTRLARIRHLAWRFLRTTRCQVAVSVGVGAVVVAINVASGTRIKNLTLGTFGSYFGFLGGLAAILVLVSSMTVGLLVYYLQGVTADYHYFYDRFRLSVADLRTYLDSLCDTGVIGRSYDDPYREIEGMLNSVNLSLSWQNNVMPFVEVIRGELTDNLDEAEEFNWAFGRVLTYLSLAEEAAKRDRAESDKANKFADLDVARSQIVLDACCDNSGHIDRSNPLQRSLDYRLEWSGYRNRLHDAPASSGSRTYCYSGVQRVFRHSRIPQRR